MNNWINIYKTDRIFEAEIISAHLQDNGIVNTILNQRDTAYGTFGNIFIRVPEDLKEQALLIIQNISLDN
jgi:hypothetical protein